MSTPGVGPHGKAARKAQPSIRIAGWYSDPLGLDGERYWDGASWTDKFVPTTMPADKLGIGAKVVIFVAAVVALLVVGGFIAALTSDPGGPGTTRAATTSSNPPMRITPATMPMAKIGEYARDANLSFKITRVSIEGARVFVYMDVANVGTSPQAFDLEAQRLMDRQGRTYAPNLDVAIKRNDPSNYFTINPGFYYEVVAPFDVPANTELGSLTLRDSTSSVGVMVDLRQGGSPN